jgi:hypothetical protein
MIEMLYKKKIIRDFLSLFTENYWKQLISCILEYGIINFKKHHNIASLTPEDIIAVVESLKKEENLVDKKRTNLIISNQINNLNNANTKNSNKLNSKNVNASRSRSKSTSANKDGRNILKSNTLLTTVNKNKILDLNSNSNNSSFLNNKNKHLKSSNTSSVDKSINSALNALRPITSQSNTVANKKLRTSQTPSRENNLKSFTGNLKRKKIGVDKSDSSQSVSRSKNKLVNQSGKNLISSGKKNNLNKNSFIDSDNEGHGVLKSSRLNRDNSNLNIKSSISNTNTNILKKKKPTEILEQAHLNKLKEKKKKLFEKGQESKEKDNFNNNLTDDDIKSNTNLNNKKFSSNINENANLSTQNLITTNSNNNSTQNLINNSTGGKFNNVKSRIKSVIENDKKIYNMLKNNPINNFDTNSDNLNIPKINNDKITNSNIKIEDSETGNKNFSPKSTEKFIGDGNYLHKTNYSSTAISNNAKSSILSLEEKLNGLTQKISKVEKSSTFMSKYK